MSQQQTRKTILAIGVMIPLLLGFSACSESVKPDASPSSTPTSSAVAGVEDKVDSPIAAKMYENYLNKLYSVQATDIQAIVAPLVADGELSSEDTTILVEELKTTYPELFGAFYTEDLTDDETAMLFYSLTSIAKTLNDENITANITVPSSAIIINGTAATVDAKQVVAESEGNILAIGDEPTDVNLTKKNDTWFIVPPADIVSADATTEEKE
jgi:hypothetical protein